MTDFDEHVWKMMEAIAASERHFNQLQHQYRVMASGWILAMFSGLQYALSNWGNLPLPSAMILALIGLAGAVGITQLWNLDLRVYHQLLEAYFVEGLRLESQHAWLPQLRSRMLATQEPGKGVLARVVWFYLAGTGAALLIAVTGLVLMVPAGNSLALIGAAAIGLLAAGLWCRSMWRETRSPQLAAWLAEGTRG